MKTLKTIFSKTGLFIFAYFVTGFFLGPPQGGPGGIPAKPDDLAGIGHWIMYVIQIFIWPIGLITQHGTVRL